MGTLLIPGLLILLGSQFLFGWAKPVPVNWNNLHHPQRDMALVALAGPAANLLMAFLWGLLAKIGLEVGGMIHFLLYMGIAGIIINLILMILNLIPIPPLDGSKIVASFLSPSAVMTYYRLETYGFIILVILLVTGLLGNLLMVPFSYLFMNILDLFGLPSNNILSTITAEYSQNSFI